MKTIGQIVAAKAAMGWPAVKIAEFINENLGGGNKPNRPAGKGRVVKIAFAEEQSVSVPVKMAA